MTKLTDLQLARYILTIAKKNKWRNSSSWELAKIQKSKLGEAVAYTIFSGTMYTQITFAIQLLKTWIDNPAAAAQYITKEDTSELRLLIAKHFLEHGV